MVFRSPCSKVAPCASSRTSISSAKRSLEWPYWATRSRRRISATSSGDAPANLGLRRREISQERSVEGEPDNWPPERAHGEVVARLCLAARSKSPGGSGYTLFGAEGLSRLARFALLRHLQFLYSKG